MPLSDHGASANKMDMKAVYFSFCGAELTALPSGALWWQQKDLLVVSDLHLGKSERQARLGGGLIPPYETRDTLLKLETDLQSTKARTVITLGDSFDDGIAAHNLSPEEKQSLMRLQQGHRWIWISGNHDPEISPLSGEHCLETSVMPLHFRHIARQGASAEVSGHYHPKAAMKVRAQHISRRCLLYDDAKVILPAYGTYTGGLWITDPALSGLMERNARAILIGEPMVVIPAFCAT